MKKLVALESLALAFMLLSTGMANATTETYVFMVGKVASYGPVPAFGLLKAFAKIDDWARVKAAWMTAPIPIVPGSPASPVVFSFFTAHLVNASIVKLDFTDKMNRTHDFFVAGIWNVLNVTFVFKESTFFWISKPMIDHGPGILAVDPDPVNGTPWTVFTLAIQDFLPVRGLVAFHKIKTVEIPEGDITLDSKVDIRDIAAVAKSYGTMPGRRGFDFQLDINFDFQIDIRDIASVARAYGTEY
jgi:hypothetical protein